MKEDCRRIKAGYITGKKFDIFVLECQKPASVSGLEYRYPITILFLELNLELKIWGYLITRAIY